MEKKAFEEIRETVSPLAQQFLDDPAMFEQLKKVSPGLTEEYLKIMLQKTVDGKE